MEFRRNPLLESLLKSLNTDLFPAEQLLLSRYEQCQKSDFPIVLIMGPPRSGTTLFMQWLAGTGLFAYPTNLLSRFYRAPIIGAKIQLLLTDKRYNFRNELGEFYQDIDYRSHNGKTRGAVSPNEFWYFWRRFLSEPERETWTDEELHRSFDKRTMLAELSGIRDVFRKPFAAKGMIFNYNIPFLDSLFDKAIFVQMIRDPISNVASLLDARRRQLGSEDYWYSFKVPEYEALMEMSPVDQVAGQVSSINHAVTSGLDRVTELRKVTVQYEKFCADPMRIYQEICSKAGVAKLAYLGPEKFDVERSIGSKQQVVIENALGKF